MNSPSVISSCTHVRINVYHICKIDICRENIIPYALSEQNIQLGDIAHGLADWLEGRSSFFFKIREVTRAGIPYLRSKTFRNCSIAIKYLWQTGVSARVNIQTNETAIPTGEMFVQREGMTESHNSSWSCNMKLGASCSPVIRSPGPSMKR